VGEIWTSPDAAIRGGTKWLMVLEMRWYRCSWLVFLPPTQSESKIAVEESSMALIDGF
jgi:hypothetical protein